jgi:23S rRNA pseudouridine955/2504/2580 synthase
MSGGATPPSRETKSGVTTATVSEDEAGIRVDRWFKRRYPALALSHLAKICRKGEVRVDGKRVETSTRLEEGQKVRVPPLRIETPAAPAVKRATPEDARALKEMTLFEDKDVLVLNKPYGLATQGGSGQKRHIDGMLEALAKGDARPVLVHRLDRDTSGALLVAKSRRMAAELGDIFRSRRAKKIYWALVEGVPKPAQGRVSLYLAKGAGMERSSSSGWRQPEREERKASSGWRQPEREERKASSGWRQTQRDAQERMRVANHGDADARHSLTYYAIVDKVAPRCAWLSMKPLTGRTHQLRAHAEAIGHPIFGDPKYGHRPEDEVRRRDPLRAMPDGLERKLHLLARRLILPHPRGGMIDVTAPLPPHMAKSWELFGFDVKQYDPIEEAPEE